MIWSQSAINTWTGKYALLKFICSTGCVSCGFHGHSEDRFKCRLHSVSGILFFIFQRPERKIWVLIQGAPAQLQSVARTLKTETHSLHPTGCETHCVCLCAHMYIEEVFVSFFCSVQREVAQPQKLIGAGAAVSMSTAAGCWPRRKSVWLCSTSCSSCHILLWDDRHLAP